MIFTVHLVSKIYECPFAGVRHKHNIRKVVIKKLPWVSDTFNFEVPREVIYCTATIIIFNLFKRKVGVGIGYQLFRRGCVINRRQFNAALIDSKQKAYSYAYNNKFLHVLLLTMKNIVSAPSKELISSSSEFRFFPVKFL